MNASRQLRIRAITRLIQQSPFRLFSDSEITAKAVLTPTEFDARATDFIMDAESGLSADPDEMALAKAVLARMHSNHLAPAVARAYMAPLELAPSYRPPVSKRAVVRRYANR